MSSVDLTTCSTAELQAELGRREAEARAERKRQLEEEAAHNLAKINTILTYVEHNRTTCSDDDPKNAYCNSHGHPRCVRCWVLQAKRDGFWDPLMRFNVTVTLEPVTL